MTNPRIREMLFAEAENYTDRDAYISDLATSSRWGDDPTPAELLRRAEYVGMIYDAAHATTQDLLKTYGLTQTALARYFGIPQRTLQKWCAGKAQPPHYILAMAAEILARDCGR